MKIRLSDHFTYPRLLRFCLSPIITMVFTSVYGVVDGYFISNYVGKDAFAAVNLIMPFLMIMGGFGFMIGTGGSALTAKLLGEKENERANRCFTMMVRFTLVLGLLLSVLGIVLMRPITQLLVMGAQDVTEQMIECCVVYGRTVMLFNASFMLQSVFHPFLMAAEKPKLVLTVTVAAGVCNMVLDALFVAVFRWGVVGAALATGISQCVGGLLPLLYFLRPNKSLLRLVKTKTEARLLLRACANGSSELMSNISMSLVSILYNVQLLRLAGENGVSAFGTLMYIQFIFASIFIGYTVGMAPIVSYHYGAGNHGELKSLLRKSVLLMGIAGALMTVLARLLADPLSAVFVGYDRELYDMTRHAFRLFSFAFLFAGLNIFASSFFTALNNGAISATISFLRTLLFQTLSVLLLPLLLGLDGIWWAITVAELPALLVSVAFVLAKRKKYHYL